MKKVSLLTLCDIIAPGLALAQGIGRWGNYFNMEAFGLPVTDPALQFFPFAVLINEGSTQVWHMATFFYESLADILIGIFLVAVRHKMMKKTGDTFCWYLLLYGAARLITEHYRMDSLFSTGGSFRISQILSVAMCLGVLIYFSIRMIRNGHYLERKGRIGMWASITVIAVLFIRLFRYEGNADPFLLYRYCFALLAMILLTDMTLVITFNKHKVKGLIAPVILLIILIFHFRLYSSLVEGNILTVASSTWMLMLFSLSSIMTGAIVYHRATEAEICQ